MATDARKTIADASSAALPEKRAKLFRNGRSQAVRLPKEFRFEGTEVAIRKIEATGDVVLSPVRKEPKRSLKEWFKVFDSLEIPADFFERVPHMPVERDIFK